MLPIILLLTTIYYCKPDNKILVLLLLICCILLKQYDIEHYSYVDSKNLIKNIDFHKSNIIDTPQNITKIMKSDDEDKKQQLKFTCELNKYITTTTNKNPWNLNSDYIDIKSIDFIDSEFLNLNYKIKTNNIKKALICKIKTDKSYIYTYNNNLNNIKKNNWYLVTLNAANISDKEILITPYISTSIGETKDMEYDFFGFQYEKIINNKKLNTLKWIIFITPENSCKYNSFNFYIHNSSNTTCILHNPTLKHITDIDKYLQSIKSTTNKIGYQVLHQEKVIGKHGICKFPFAHNGKVYTDCVSETINNEDYSWCKLEDNSKAFCSAPNNQLIIPKNKIDSKPMIDSNGTPVLDSNGTPVLDSNGKPILGSDGTPVICLNNQLPYTRNKLDVIDDEIDDVIDNEIDNEDEIPGEIQDESPGKIPDENEDIISEEVESEYDNLLINPHDMKYVHNELLHLIRTIYIHNNQDPDFYKEYVDHLLKIMKKINSNTFERYIKELVQPIILMENQCNTTLRRIIAHNIKIFNKVHSNTPLNINLITTLIQKFKRKEKPILNKTNINEELLNIVKETDPNYVEHIGVVIKNLITSYKTFVQNINLEPETQIDHIRRIDLSQYDKTRELFKSISSYIDYENIVELIENSILDNKSILKLELYLQSPIYLNWQNFIQKIPDNIKMTILKNDSIRDGNVIATFDNYLYHTIFVIISKIIKIINDLNRNNVDKPRLPEVINFELSEKDPELNTKLMDQVGDLVLKLIKPYVSNHEYLKIIHNRQLQNTNNEDDVNEEIDYEEDEDDNIMNDGVDTSFDNDENASMWKSITPIMINNKKIDVTKNAEDVCENRGFSKTQCSKIPCCHWYGDDCWSNVDNNRCDSYKF